jgi:hypothetical protein
MNIQEQIDAYIATLSEPKRSELESLHRLILGVMPKAKLWFEDGKNSENKTVSNPNIGYGSYTIQYANGTSREFYRVGLSANTAGISVYILGIKNKSYLADTYAKTLGKAKVTGYCIKFKSIKEIHLPVLTEAIRYGLEQVD